MFQSFLDALLRDGLKFHTHWVVVLAVLARVAVRGTARESDARARAVFGFMMLFVHVALLVAASALAAARSPLANEAVLVAGLVGTLTWVFLVGVVVFEGVVRRIRPNTPRIVVDVVTLVVAAVALIRMSSRLGLELSGIIATSAVLTAVIGLALQDTLGNVLGGLALQLDQSVRVGDWIKVGDVTGRVSEIHWRYTAVETRNWETVIVPNNLLTKQQVTVLGRRQGMPNQWRRWVKFQVDYRQAPNRVIEIVETALRGRAIVNVATDPPPNCIAFEFGDSAIVYAVRYMLTDLSVDDPTDSNVRTTIFYALRRAQIPFSVPSQSLLLDDELKRAERTYAADQSQRRAALSRITLFRDLAPDEIAELAERLHTAPFLRGEVLTRMGAEAHYLYTIVSGSVSVRIVSGSDEREVSTLGPGDFFGEMALLTGERRRANVVALSDVDCYRLDAEAFRRLLERRPELAERVAVVLAERKVGLEAVSAALDESEHARLVEQSRIHLLSRIREFFALG